MKKYIACVCVLILSSALPAQQQQPPQKKSLCDEPPDKVFLTCSCPADTKPDPKLRCKDDPRGYTFSWISDTDQMPNSDTWCYYRGFKNLHPTTTVTVDFPEAGMIAVEVTPGGVSVDMVQNQPVYQTPAKDYPLYYAPLADTQVAVGLFKPQQPKEAALNRRSGAIGAPPTANRASPFDTNNPIVVEIRRDLRDKQSGEDYTISLSLTSSVTKVQKNYRYHVEVQNKSNVSVRLDWVSIRRTDDQAFIDKVLSALTHDQSPDAPGFTLEPGKALEATSQTKRSPGLSLGVVNIYQANTLVAKAFAPAYVPNSDLLRR